MTAVRFSTPTPGRWLTPTAIVAGTFAVLLAVLGGTAFSTFRGAPPELRFFDPRRSPTFDETCVVSAIDYAFSSDEKNDVIFLGDSVCRTGLDPVEFERLTGWRAYNLGIVGDLGPGVMLNVAQAYFAKHPPPRIVVLCVSPVGLEKDVPWYWVKLRDHFVNCYGFDTRSAKSLAASAGYAVRQGTVLTWDRVASSFAESPSSFAEAPRAEVPRELTRDVRDKSLIGMEQVTYHKYERLTREKRGHFELPGRGPYKNLDRPGGIVLVHDAWESGLRRLAETCDHWGIPLMIRFGPVSAEATKNLKFDGVEQSLQNLQKSYPRLLLPDDQRILRYSPGLCWDYSHPNPQGTQQFTKQVAAEVQAALDLARNARSR
jgi:hypothetical protein